MDIKQITICSGSIIHLHKTQPIDKCQDDYHDDLRIESWVPHYSANIMSFVMIIVKLLISKDYIHFIKP